MNASALDANDNCANAEAALTFWQPITTSVESGRHNQDELAQRLVPCLASENSTVRDDTAYNLLTYWLRQDALSNAVKRSIYQQLLNNMENQHPSVVLLRSFSSLVMSELIRADTFSRFLSDKQRSDLLAVTLLSLSEETDFRGLEADVGWVHPIAHLSDVLWRLAMHPRTSAHEKQLILGGVKTKIGEAQEGFRFNEGDRFARVAAAIIVEQSLEPSNVIQWMREFENSLSNASWNDAFKTPHGMIELHNSKLFIRALSDQLLGEVVDAQLTERLDRLIQLFTDLV